MKTKLLLALATGAAIALASGAAAQDRKFVNIGTAGIGGGYYPTGGFICNVLNKSREAQGHNIRCTVESTGGSVANLRSIQAGELDVAIAQADWQYHSYRGSSKFEDVGANEDLRFLFSLHIDTAHLVARADAGATSFDDLEGKIVNIGNAGSGTEATMNFALSRYDTDAESYFGQATRLTSREQAQALCDGKIDAFFYTTGVTASSITEATNTCDATVLNWNDETIDAMIEEFPYYGKSIIPNGTYRGQTEELTTWGLPATLVASASADEEVVYNMVKAVFDNFEDFTAQSTLYVAITREGAVVNGRSVPVHPGAERYFKEVGLME
ncbi:TAXI family TRAP transporter solute-binding subunit [Pelagibius litoralis]|uniref:TAXI family TRAP transporter solute-binding subunit n=1 Tax=Pelagibius litoralis TaxID=374515 RepID=A0A967KHJ2_9PROT|nr:TAXI family TRAP transporter solute-binding subunit [Pelagibius litoralis]NIA71326.1 TAXI family TRAP transporter solute-binding subunit [Pelagibius litoralis]